MSHKVNPVIHRIPAIHTWDSKWYAKKELLPKFLEQEVKIREYFTDNYKDAGIDAVSIERSAKDVAINILAAKPGVIIGRNGEGLEKIRKDVEKKFLQFKHKVKVNVMAVRNPALSSQILAQNAASEIERRMPFRRVMKQMIEKSMAAGAKGIKVRMSGRLNGAEIARTEKLGAGKMSLITFRSDVDYAFVEANTIYGKIGIKVWIYHGESFRIKDKFEKKEEDKKVVIKK